MNQDALEVLDAFACGGPHVVARLEQLPGFAQAHWGHGRGLLAEKLVRHPEFMPFEPVAVEVYDSKGALIRKRVQARAAKGRALLDAFEGLGFEKNLELLGILSGGAHEPTVRATLADDALLPTYRKNEIPRLSEPKVLNGHDLLMNGATRIEGKKLLFRDVIPYILVLATHIDCSETVLIRPWHVLVHPPRGAARTGKRLVLSLIHI